MKRKPASFLAYAIVAFMGLVVLVSMQQVAGGVRPQGRLLDEPASPTLLRSSTATKVATYRPAPTATPSRTPLPPTSTKTQTPEPPTNTPVPGLPAKYFITNITGHRQVYSIGCEAAAAVDWARYFGVRISEKEFQSELPVSDNPDLGFVGNVEGPWGHVPPDDYGVHAEPVAALLRDYGLNAVAAKGLTLDAIKASVAHDRPVIAWVIGNVTYGTPEGYVDSEGNVTTVAPYEHVVIVIGYGSQTIRYMNNGEQYDVTNKMFLASWGVLGNMAVVMPDDLEVNP